MFESIWNQFGTQHMVTSFHMVTPVHRRNAPSPRGASARAEDPRGHVRGGLEEGGRGDAGKGGGVGEEQGDAQSTFG